MNEKDIRKSNFASVIADVDKVKALKQKKPKKASVSLRPLQFDESDEDTPLKAEIIRRINEKKLVYSDLYNYCTKIKNGDVAEGQKLGYNIISGLRTRHSMIDSTVSLLADFLELDIYFVDRHPAEDADDEDLSDEIED